MPRRRIHGLTCLVAVMTATAATLRLAAQDGLDLDARVAAIMPSNDLRDRVMQLDDQIKRLREQLPPTDDAPALMARRAAIQMRLIARQLLAAADPADTGSPGVLFGCTLADGMTAFDARFDRCAERSPSEPGADSIQDALRQFVSAATQAERGPATGELYDARSYLHRTLTPLLPLLRTGATGGAGGTEGTGGDGNSGATRGTGNSGGTGGGIPLVGVWPPALDAPPTAPGSAQPLPTAANVAALTERLAALPGASAPPAELTDILHVLQRAAAVDALGPMVAQSYRLMDRTIDLLAALDAAAWLSDQQRAVLEAALADALAAYQNPARRDDATDQFERLFALEPILQHIAAFDAKDPQATPLRAVVGAALVQLGDPTTRPIGAALVQWVDRVSAVVLQHRTLARQQLDADLRIAFTRLEQHYQTTEQNVLQSAGDLAADPTLINQPKLTVPVTYLEQVNDDLDRLTQLRGRLQRVNRIAARSSFDLTRRMREDTDQLMDPGQSLAAVEKIAGFDRQVRRFTELAGENELHSAVDKADGSAWPYVGARGRELLACIDAARRAWLDAWAQGRPADDAGAVMRDLSALMALLHRSAAIERLCRSDATLNRWAAVQIDLGVINGQAAALRDAVKRGLDAALADDAESLHNQMESLRHDHAAIIVLVEADHQLHARLSALDDDAATVLSQVLLDPWPDALLGDQRDDLATLSRCLNERSAATADANMSDSQRSYLDQQMRATALRLAVELPMPASVLLDAE